MRYEALDREKLINEIWVNKGKVGLIAESLGVTTKTIYNYVDKYATVKAALDDARLHFDESLVDHAEMKIETAVREGEPWAVRYVLATKGKKRGYAENHSVEVSGPDNGAIPVSFVDYRAGLQGATSETEE